MEQLQLEASLTVVEVLDRWPQTIPLFMCHHMACVGCVMAPFETLADVATVYKLDLDRFLRELEQVIQHTGFHSSAGGQGYADWRDGPPGS